MTSTGTQPAVKSIPRVPRARRRFASTVSGVAAQLASWRVWIVSAAVFGVFASLLFGSSAAFSVRQVTAACGQEPPDVRFTSSGDQVSRFLNTCGGVGRDAYQAMQIADLFYPMVVGMFMATSLALVLARLAPRQPSVVAVAVLPLLGTAFDYLENVFAWLALAAFPAPSASISLLGVASAAKTLTFWAAGALLLASLSALVFKEACRRRVRPPTDGGSIVAEGEAP